MARITSLVELCTLSPLVRTTVEMEGYGDEQHLGRVVYRVLVEYVRTLLVLLRGQRVPLLSVPAWPGSCQSDQLAVLQVLLQDVAQLEHHLRRSALVPAHVDPINHAGCAGSTSVSA